VVSLELFELEVVAEVTDISAMLEVATLLFDPSKIVTDTLQNDFLDILVAERLLDNSFERGTLL